MRPENTIEYDLSDLKLRKRRKESEEILCNINNEWSKLNRQEIILALNSEDKDALKKLVLPSFSWFQKFSRAGQAESENRDYWRCMKFVDFKRGMVRGKSKRGIDTMEHISWMFNFKNDEPGAEESIDVKNDILEKFAKGWLSKQVIDDVLV